MRFQRRLVPIDLEEVVDIGILLVTQHIEPNAAWLVSLGSDCVILPTPPEPAHPGWRPWLGAAGHPILQYNLAP